MITRIKKSIQVGVFLGLNPVQTNSAIRKSINSYASGEYRRLHYVSEGTHKGTVGYLLTSENSPESLYKNNGLLRLYTPWCHDTVHIRVPREYLVHVDVKDRNTTTRPMREDIRKAVDDVVQRLEKSNMEYFNKFKEDCNGIED